MSYPHTPPRPARHAVLQLPPAEGEEPYTGGMSYALLRGSRRSNAEIRADLAKGRHEYRHSRNHRRSQKERWIVKARRHRDLVRSLRRVDPEVLLQQHDDRVSVSLTAAG